MAAVDMVEWPKALLLGSMPDGLSLCVPGKADKEEEWRRGPAEAKEEFARK